MASTLLYSSAPHHIFDSPVFKNPFPAATENTTTPLSPNSNLRPPLNIPGRGLRPTATATPKADLSWKTEPVGLDKLYQISTSLPKSDWEITPIQAWFKLVERYPAHVLLSNIPTSTNPSTHLHPYPHSDSPTGYRSFPPGDRVNLLHKLKQGLSKIVNCFAFGAVMDEARFWEVVEKEMENVVQH
jgi:hypothetical protein